MQVISLATLPYDLLLNIARHLELLDIYALQLTCKSLHAFAVTRPVYRNLATALLRRCRALPLHGFQRLSDLTDEQLIEAVNQATRLEKAWLTRGPRPSTNSSYLNTPDGSQKGMRKWYKVISAPPNEEVDWLSPITSSYSLCATKSGKVVCWDVHRDICLAEWDPKERWELWKCRVEFDIRTVFFTMAKVLQRSYDDRVMEFVLMKLEFFDDDREPQFSELAVFKTIGVVMNVFLLDPSSRLLSAFVWVSSSNTIGLYALLDWKKNEYVFVDTGVECSLSSNWSCILYKGQIVIHSEESDVAHQYFYPISVLQRHARPSSPLSSFVPSISERLPPITTMTANFIFPPQTRGNTPASVSEADVDGANGHALVVGPGHPAHDNGVVPNGNPNGHAPEDGDDGGSVADSNPFPYPPWYPESAHFVRQWWPTLASVPRLSCTVVLLADHEPDTHRTRYVLAQHYFKVPLVEPDEAEQISASASRAVAAKHGFLNGTSHSMENGCGASPTPSASSHDTELATDGDVVDLARPPPQPEQRSRRGTPESSMMRLWYVSEPFEVVCVLDGMDDDLDPDGSPERPRPLMAVDFGHAVWIEFAFPPELDRDEKRLRFVTFPPVTNDRDEMGYGGTEAAESLEGIVRTLEVPDELDLDTVETINIDQSQGAIIISVRDGKIFILCYE
ncbi:hypothetical protein DICSQDRAFT_62111 [Dichomitus squalens LYAD-421 SS1]|uniref:F-box domain-containing protein n=1 Tax=Dichomitus squalens (strain LYAD-421) TaxID=732165 RepID=R7SXK9_DICSQ|nr:uncharacterized protein DICSQDRAFT_62111 [Dichomitus squalens LYAD-421 SS1]EJF60658.1 hypothetical protein DICSQDRAFT_62111 [Dichomitus squalens LYAD-421 SS1]